GASGIETWSFDPAASTWTHQAAGDFPSPPNLQAGVVYDAPMDQFLYVQAGTVVTVHGWSPSHAGGWSIVTQSPLLPRSAGAWFALDTSRHRLVVGESPDPAPGSGLGAVEAALDGSAAWRVMSVLGPAPLDADRTHAVYDAAQDALLLGAGDPHSGT